MTSAIPVSSAVSQTLSCRAANSIFKFDTRPLKESKWLIKKVPNQNRTRMETLLPRPLLETLLPRPLFQKPRHGLQHQIRKQLHGDLARMKRQR